MKKKKIPGELTWGMTADLKSLICLQSLQLRMYIRIENMKRSSLYKYIFTISLVWDSLHQNSRLSRGPGISKFELTRAILTR